MTTEFNASVRLDATEAGAVAITATATATECAAIAERFGLDTVADVVFQGQLRRLPPGDIYEASGEATMTAERVCIVTLEPFLEKTSAAYTELLTTDPDAVSDESAPDGPDETEITLIEGKVVDLGEIALQYLAMNLDPYPRGPDAGDAEPAATETTSDDPKSRRPFAGLDRMLAARNRPS